MAAGLGSDEHSWAWSVVDAVGPIADRDVRWNGTVAVGITPGRDTAVSRLHSPQPYLILPEHHADTLREAYDRQTGAAPRDESAAAVQDRWSALVDATGSMTSQVVRMTGPLPDLTDPKAYPEVAFDDGLGDVWTTPERLAAVWQESDSAQLMLHDDVPSPSFAYAGTEPNASAVRDVIAEIARQQGREATPADYSVISDELIQLPPDRRWDAVIDSAGAVHGVRSDVSRYQLVETLRRDFLTAVEQGNPGSGTPDSAAARALRGVTAEPLDAHLSAMTRDPAMAPVTPGRTPGSDGASVRPQRPGDSAVRRSPRSDRGRGGRH
jgi:hypothetical protein